MLPRFRDLRYSDMIHRGLIFTGFSFGCLLLIALVGLWVRARRQEASVSALLAVTGALSIEAQYEPYHYSDPYGLHRPFQPGTLQIIKRGGQRAHGFGVVDDPPRLLGWSVPVFGENCFVRVTDIYLSDEHFSDSDVDLLLSFPDLRELRLSNTKITDAGLAKILTLKRLTVLDIDGTNVSANGLRQLSRLTELRELNISDTAADDQIGAELKRALPKCWIGY